MGYVYITSYIFIYIHLAISAEGLLVLDIFVFIYLRRYVYTCVYIRLPSYICYMYIVLV